MTCRSARPIHPDWLRHFAKKIAQREREMARKPIDRRPRIVWPKEET